MAVTEATPFVLLVLPVQAQEAVAACAHTNLALVYFEQYFSDKHKFAARSNEAEMEAQGALSTAPRKSLEVSPRLVLAGLFIDRQRYALARE